MKLIKTKSLNNRTVKKKRPVYMLDAVSGMGMIMMWGGSRFLLIVAVMILVYFALKKLDQIKMEKAVAAEAATMRIITEDEDDENEGE